MHFLNSDQLGRLREGAGFGPCRPGGFLPALDQPGPNTGENSPDVCFLCAYYLLYPPPLDASVEVHDGDYGR